MDSSPQKTPSKLHKRTKSGLSFKAPKLFQNLKHLQPSKMIDYSTSDGDDEKSVRSKSDQGSARPLFGALSSKPTTSNPSRIKSTLSRCSSKIRRTISTSKIKGKDKTVTNDDDEDEDEQLSDHLTNLNINARRSDDDEGFETAWPASSSSDNGGYSARSSDDFGGGPSIRKEKPLEMKKKGKKKVKTLSYRAKKESSSATEVDAMDIDKPNENIQLPSLGLLNISRGNGNDSPASSLKRKASLEEPGSVDQHKRRK